MEAARRATAGDLPRLAELVRAAIVELRPGRGGAVWASREARAEPVEDRLATELADTAGSVVVAGTIADAVVGYAVATTERLRDGSQLAVLSDIYVEEEAREVGVGEAMLGFVVDWAEQAGCSGIDSFVLPGNRAAKNFFETWGLVARGIVVHRPLPGA